LGKFPKCNIFLGKFPTAQIFPNPKSKIFQNPKSTYRRLLPVLGAVVYNRRWVPTLLPALGAVVYNRCWVPTLLPASGVDSPECHDVDPKKRAHTIL
jgi:hypothetical protein